MTETPEQMLQRVQELADSYSLSVVERQSLKWLLAAYAEVLGERDRQYEQNAEQIARIAALEKQRDQYKGSYTHAQTTLDELSKAIEATVTGEWDAPTQALEELVKQRDELRVVANQQVQIGMQTSQHLKKVEQERDELKVMVRSEADRRERASHIFNEIIARALEDAAMQANTGPGEAVTSEWLLTLASGYRDDGAISGTLSQLKQIEENLSVFDQLKKQRDAYLAWGHKNHEYLKLAYERLGTVNTTISGVGEPWDSMRVRQYEVRIECEKIPEVIAATPPAALAALTARERNAGAVEALRDICKDDGIDGGKAYLAKVIYRESPHRAYTTVGVVNANDILCRADEIEKEARNG